MRGREPLHGEIRYPLRSMWLTGYAAIVASSMLVVALARRRVGEPFLGLSLMLVLLLMLGWLFHARFTLYSVLFLTATSEFVTIEWFPFARNFSSPESISYVADALIISPLEVTLIGGVVVSCLRRYADTGRLVAPSPLTRPLVVFMIIVALAFGRGIAAGGDMRAALYEVRAIPYILMMFILVTNECRERIHLRGALWSVLLGVVVQSILSIEYFSRLSVAERENVDGLTEHGSVLGQALLIVTFISLVLFARRAALAKWAVLLGLVPTAYVFMVAERRAGIAALAAAGGLVATSLFWKRRRTFWYVVPLAVLMSSAYVGAFWNTTSSAGFPAQAIKTVIAPGSATEENLYSDLYRWAETYDVVFTIRSSPLVGLGFGHAFYRPIPLPDISTFDLAAYRPHNSVLWIWIKTGIVGFATMFYVFAKTLLYAAQAIRRSRDDIDLVVLICSASFVVMYGVFTYVDISWDVRNTVLLGMAIAMCTKPYRWLDGDQPDEPSDLEARHADDVRHRTRPAPVFMHQ